MSLVLYHTKPCRYTPAIQRVFDYLQAPYELRCVSADELSRLPGSVYGESPILNDDGKIIEDWRMILRYIDEKRGGKLTQLEPAVQDELFSLCGEIEKEILYKSTPSSVALEKDERLERSDFLLARLLLGTGKKA